MNFLKGKGLFFEGLVYKKCVNRLISQKRRLSDNCVRLSYHNITPLNSKTSPESDSPVLIFHGLFGNKNNWKSISKSIASKTGRSVYAFDLRNHGSSPHTSGPDSTLEGMANDIKLFMDENNYERATLLGHRIEKLIAVDITPLSSIPTALFLYPNFIDKLSDSIKDVSNDLGLGDARRIVDKQLKTLITDQFIRGFFLMGLDKDESGKLIWKTNLESIKYMIENKHINQIRVEQPFNGETLLVHGQNSEYVNTNDYNAIREVLPNVKIVSIPETGHYLHIEKPNEFIDCVVSFLNSN